MSTNAPPVLNDPAAREQELARGLDNFATPEQQNTTTNPVTEEQSTPTRSDKKKGKGKFSTMASNATQVHPQAQAGPPAYAAPQAPAAPPAAPSNDKSHMISGRIVGAGAREPEWSQEELEYFAELRSYKLDVVTVTDSRKAQPDSNGYYVVKNADGTCAATMNAMLPGLSMDEIKLGVGTAKPDERLPKKKMYSDVVAVGKNGDWVLNQWVSQDVIMEPVPANVRNRSVNIRSGGKGSERTIGVHFARFGFPAKSFAPIFHTLGVGMPGLIDSLVMTDGYYWANASWGVTQTPGTFVYKTEQGTRATTHQLTDAMDMMGTRSCIGIGIFAISVACAYEKQGDTVVPSSTKYEFSIKCHNFLGMGFTDWHGPPQTSAIGMILSDDFMRSAQSMSKPKVTTNVMNSTSNLFGSGNVNPFASLTTPQGGQAEKAPGASLL